MMLAFQFSLLLHHIKCIRQHFRSVLLGNMIVRDALGLHHLRHADAQSIRKWLDAIDVRQPQAGIT